MPISVVLCMLKPKNLRSSETGCESNTKPLTFRNARVPYVFQRNHHSRHPKSQYILHQRDHTVLRKYPPVHSCGWAAQCIRMMHHSVPASYQPQVIALIATICMPAFAAIHRGLARHSACCSSARQSRPCKDAPRRRTNAHERSLSANHSSMPCMNPTNKKMLKVCLQVQEQHRALKSTGYNARGSQLP
jgi:hypothetical protein